MPLEPLVLDSLQVELSKTYCRPRENHNLFSRRGAPMLLMDVELTPACRP
jgi:hypothetical protein